MPHVKSNAFPAIAVFALCASFVALGAADDRAPADPLDGPPVVTAKSWAVADGKTGALLWGHEAATPRKAASTAKLMCAYVVLQLADADPKVLDETVTFSERADKTTGSTADIRTGESLAVRDCLYGLLLPSGNDAGVALAEHFGDRLKPASGNFNAGADPRDNFIAEMNRTAKRLGLKDTTYYSPYGDGSASNQMTSTAQDLAKFASTAMKHAAFARYVGTRRHECVVKASDGSDRTAVWENTNKLLEIEGFDGVKTGTTTAAGYCLVSSARRGDDHLITVVLGTTSADSRVVDSRNLVRWAWTQRAGAAK
jgi:D-alanyl-D-alanine carboxypeptidase (penicillin-binding protein 5/6)